VRSLHVGIRLTTWVAGMQQGAGLTSGYKKRIIPDSGMLIHCVDIPIQLKTAKESSPWRS